MTFLVIVAEDEDEGDDDHDGDGTRDGEDDNDPREGRGEAVAPAHGDRGVVSSSEVAVSDGEEDHARLHTRERALLSTVARLHGTRDIILRHLCGRREICVDCSIPSVVRDDVEALELVVAGSQRRSRR